MQIQEAVQLMNQGIGEFTRSFLASAVEPDIYLRQLKKTVEELEAKIDNATPPKPPLDAEEVWAKWRTKGYEINELDLREVRTLCVSPATAMRPKLIEALTESPDSLKRFRTLCGFVNAYFDQWRTMENPERAEKLIQDAVLLRLASRNSRVIDVWRKSPFLFSDQAGQRVGAIAYRERKALGQVCSEFFVGASTPLAAEVLEQATIQAVNALVAKQNAMNQEEALKELLWIRENALTSNLKPNSYRLAMSKLISSRLPERFTPFQSALVDLVHADERLGDPRLQYCAPNWRTMPLEARDRFLGWLAKETLQFFFNTLVPRNDENRRRADFWLEYAKKPGKIKDFQVAVSDDDRYKILASRTKTIPSYSTISGGRTSAFLMVFAGYGADYVVIEFSETGNAAYIYLRKAFESAGMTMRSSSFDLRNDLKRMDDAHERIIHLTESREPWETKARRMLAELGIRP